VELRAAPARYNFHLRAFPEGIRFDTTVAIDPTPGNTRAAWLDFVNTANARSLVARFSVGPTRKWTLGVTMRALVTGAYSRPDFAVVMDMWHQDVGQLARRPNFAAQPSTASSSLIRRRCSDVRQTTSDTPATRRCIVR
jgi:hypothetical protein